MRIDDLTPAQFANLVAKLGRLVGALNETGAIDRLMAMAKAAKRDDMTDEEANKTAIALFAQAIPELLEERANDVYALVAAANGQTLAEWEADFTPKKAVADVKELMAFLTDGGLAGFLA